MNEKKKILLISAQPDSIREKAGLVREDELGWFYSTLGLTPDSNKIRMVNAAEGELPQDVFESGVIIGGSACSAYDDSGWMQELKEFVVKIHNKGIPLFGVCFGFQIIAEAFDGRVEKGSKLEAGLVNITLTPEGEKDLLFDGVSKNFDIYAYHHDGLVTLPSAPDTTVLASGEVYPYQAFAIGDSTRAVQFHPELGRERIEQALTQRRQSLIDGQKMTEEEYEQLMKDLDEKEFDSVRKQIVQNFDKHFVQTYSA